MGYSKKAMFGIGWTGLLQVAIKGLSLVKFVVIAKFLSPFEFGLFGISILTIGFFQAMTEAGISSYLVQTDEDEKKLLSSTWIVSILRGGLIFLLTLLAAYPVSIFFSTEAALPIIIVASLIPLLNGLENPMVAKFQRYLDFKKEFIFRTTISFFDLLVSILLIVIYKSSLALIFALIFVALFETIISFIFINPRPNLRFNTFQIRKILHFGKWITLISAMNYFVEQLDSIVVGRMLGVGLLGVYEMAQKFSIQLMIDMGNVFSKVTFPLFSRIKNDKERTKKALIKILLVTVPLFGLITVVVFVFSKQILFLFAGTKWIAAEIPLKLFSLTGLITSIMAIITSLFLAHAKQNITAKLMLVRMFLIFIVIVPACSRFGIIGASSVSLLSYVFVLPLAMFGLREIFKDKSK
jgi:O-antigen/teichoic acid export membrane protein